MYFQDRFQKLAAFVSFLVLVCDKTQWLKSSPWKNLYQRIHSVWNEHKNLTTSEPVPVLGFPDYLPCDKTVQMMTLHSVNCWLQPAGCEANFFQFPAALHAGRP